MEENATSFILIFLFLYNLMVIKFNLKWKNEDRENGLPANPFWKKTRTKHFPVKTQAERVGKRKDQVYEPQLSREATAGGAELAEHGF